MHYSINIFAIAQNFLLKSWFVKVEYYVTRKLPVIVIYDKIIKECHWACRDANKTRMHVDW